MLPPRLSGLKSFLSRMISPSENSEFLIVIIPKLTSEWETDQLIENDPQSKQNMMRKKKKKQQPVELRVQLH